MMDLKKQPCGHVECECGRIPPEKIKVTIFTVLCEDQGMNQSFLLTVKAETQEKALAQAAGKLHNFYKKLCVGDGWNYRMFVYGSYEREEEVEVLNQDRPSTGAK